CDAIHSISINRKFIACLELHTFSSLNHDFLPQYHNTLQKADIALVCFNAQTLKIKNMQALETDYIASCFGKESLKAFESSSQLFEELTKILKPGTNLLFMSSGNWGNTDLIEFVQNNTTS
ncbi:MAG: hypothetical protein KBA06_05565, partial [Saprospiraceae bacterium]|nr:hypothetical protein [Saprospiraceae bacterium]